MSLAAISLAALLFVLVVSCFSSANVGVLAIVLAWLVGVYAGGMRIDQVLAGFPVALFLTLVGVTMLFCQAQANGTLDRVAQKAVALCRGVTGAIPLMFFALAAVLSSIGPGNIASTALVAPIGMAAAGRYGIPAFFMAMMIANGASAGSLSPIAPTGIIVNGIVARLGLPEARAAIYVNNLLVHVVVAVGGYLLLGGWRLFSSRWRNQSAGETTPQTPPASGSDVAFEWRHWLTAAVITALIVGVVFFNLNVGLGAFAGALILTLAKAVDDRAAAKLVPWNVIILVCGVTVLIALLEKTGGLELFTNFLARLAGPRTVTGVAAFFTGLISIYSSTTGVVLPAFLPMVPGLVERVGGGDAMAIIYSMNAGGHLVDVSPLSTLGALCLAAAAPGTDTRRLFNQLLAWGLSMSVVGAVVCWLVF